MEPVWILFVITLLALAAVVWAFRSSREQSARRIADLEARLAQGETRALEGRPSIDGHEDRSTERSMPASTASYDALTGALARISGYLHHAVAAPLLEGMDGDEDDLRDGAEDALDSLEDMEFFAKGRELVFERQSVDAVLREVGEEFEEKSEVSVKIRATDPSAEANLDREAFKDALYLVFFNASHFGRGNPIEVTLERAEGAVLLRIRDHGPGFTDEAIERGAEPFFSTEEGALGMGLAHADRLIRKHGGELRLGNSPRGGAEVIVRVPSI